MLLANLLTEFPFVFLVHLFEFSRSSSFKTFTEAPTFEVDCGVLLGEININGISDEYV
jgi:hypothetical protein